MASSSVLYTNFFTSLLDIKSCKRSRSSIFQHPLSKHEVPRSLPKNGSLQYLGTSLEIAPINRRSNKDFAVYCTPPEAGGIFPFWPLTENFWPPTEHSWTWLLGLVALVPVAAQRLLTLTKEVETVAETVEKIAESVENVAEDVEKMAEDVAEKLPEGSKLKQVVAFVENAAKEMEKDAQLAQDLMDKVEEVDEQVESMLTNGSKGTVKAAANDQK
ncbi:unnamed protein product [Coffea canephora]|uniref:DH200=94 genomic scaffold, scaffold_4725 n=1 Tax=Coffea canephora TaxID=49390 RepID=A0A068VP98_COFCA|nr:unnamed protein product [Coffea canephora]